MNILRIITEEINNISEEFSNDIINPKNIDLYVEYRRLNKLLFNNSLPEITLKWNSKKTALGVVNFFYNKKLREAKINFLGISSFYAIPYRVFNDVLAHEMIHVKQLHTGDYEVNDGHGRSFITEANRINSMGFGFNITKINDEPLTVSDVTKKKNKTFIAIILRLDDKFNISVTTPNVYHAEFKYVINLYQKLLNNGKFKTVDILAIQTNNPELNRFGIRRSFKNGVAYSELQPYLLNELAKDHVISHNKLNKGDPYSFNFNLGIGENLDLNLNNNNGWEEMEIS